MRINTKCKNKAAGQSLYLWGFLAHNQRSMRLLQDILAREKTQIELNWSAEQNEWQVKEAALTSLKVPANTGVFSCESLDLFAFHINPLTWSQQCCLSNCYIHFILSLFLPQLVSEVLFAGSFLSACSVLCSLHPPSAACSSSGSSGLQKVML